MNVRLNARDLPDLTFSQQFPVDFKTILPYEEQVLRFDFDVARGTYHQLWFEGVTLGWGDFRLPKPLRLDVESDAPSIEMHFSLSMESRARWGRTGEQMQFGRNEHNLIFAPHFEGSLHLAPGPNPHFFEINLSPLFWERFHLFDAPPLTDLLEAVEKKHPAMVSRHNAGMTPAMHRAIAEMREAPYQGHLKRLFLEAKVLELLALQCGQFGRAAPVGEEAFSRKDLDKLHALRAYLVEHPTAPHSLAGLARRAELNEFKLKRGFREAFGTTVFGFVRDLRMEQAQRLLREGRLNIAEVSDLTGYKNPTHFTAAFKKKFGLTPRQVLG